MVLFADEMIRICTWQFKLYYLVNGIRHKLQENVIKQIFSKKSKGYIVAMQRSLPKRFHITELKSPGARPDETMYLI